MTTPPDLEYYALRAGAARGIAIAFGLAWMLVMLLLYVGGL